MPRLTLIAALFALGSTIAHAADADVAAGQARFQQLCASCHGATGAADGPASARLRPRPRPLGDASWQSNVDDAYLKLVISRGGPAVGLSPMMIGWDHTLRGEALDDVVAYIRSLAD